MDKNYINAGLAWLRKVAAGTATSLDLPSGETIAALIKLAEKFGPAAAKRDPSQPLPETITVKLKNPFKKVAGNGELVSQIVFRTPSWSDMKAIAKTANSEGQIAAAHATLENLNESGLTGPDIDRMKGIDAERCAEALQPFLSLDTP